MEKAIEKVKVPGIAWWLLIASIIGLYCSVALTLEKFSYLQQLAAGKIPTLGCDISPLVGCGNVITTPPASIFWSLPNPVLGIIAFTVVGALAVLMLGSVKMPPWVWIGLQMGVVGGVAMVSYLQYHSIYNLHALCPYCMVVWATVIPTFWLVTLRNLKAWKPTPAISRMFYRYTPVWIAAHYTLLFMLIWFQFGTRLWA